MKSKLIYNATDLDPKKPRRINPDGSIELSDDELVKFRAEQRIENEKEAPWNSTEDSV